jgi:hypothetical protein
MIHWKDPLIILYSTANFCVSDTWRSTWWVCDRSRISDSNCIGDSRESLSFQVTVLHPIQCHFVRCRRLNVIIFSFFHPRFVSNCKAYNTEMAVCSGQCWHWSNTISSCCFKDLSLYKLDVSIVHCCQKKKNFFFAFENFLRLRRWKFLSVHESTSTYLSNSSSLARLVPCRCQINNSKERTSSVVTKGSFEIIPNLDESEGY